MVTIIHYRNKCIGCNACVEANKERWRISRKDGKCTLVGGIEKKDVYVATVNDDEWNSNVRAMNHCPVKIIKVEKSL